MNIFLKPFPAHISILWDKKTKEKEEEKATY